MSSHLNRKLLNLMEEISLRYFHVKWENGLEYILWHWIHHKSILTPSDKHKLYTAHIRANGWFLIPEEDSEERVFVSTEKWVKLFQEEFDGAVN